MPIVAHGARTTLFCAVWHQDPDRHALLEGHVACLEAQSHPVEVVYVFDGGDEPPAGLPGIHVISPEPLTIYEAWNVGTQVAQTELVGDLNLDDRLRPHAIAVMEESLFANNVDLVGGEWEVTFDRATTDAAGPLMPASTVPFSAAWPPVHGLPTRLGSGTGERGTFGPCTLWRRSLHDQVPYPHRFGNGVQIKSIGDTLWWNALIRVLGGTHVRLPVLVGNYHSHPEGQAEFRLPPEQEHVASGIGLTQFPLTGLEVRTAS